MATYTPLTPKFGVCLPAILDGSFQHLTGNKVQQFLFCQLNANTGQLAGHKVVSPLDTLFIGNAMFAAVGIQPKQTRTKIQIINIQDVVHLLFRLHTRLDVRRDD